jgi:RING finger protein 121
MQFVYNEKNHTMSSTATQQLNYQEINNTINDDEQQQVVPPIFILFTFILIILLQASIQLWKKMHRRSYLFTTFVLMWLFPMLFILFFSPVIVLYSRMIVIWIIYTTVTAWLFYLSFQKKLAKNTPKKVYAWFLLIYKLSHLATMIGTVTLFIELFTGIFSTLQHVVLRDMKLLVFFVPLPHILLFYGLYYGVLVRDCAEMCAEAMSNSMNKERNQYYLSQSVTERTCGICNLPLKNENSGIAHASDDYLMGDDVESSTTTTTTTTTATGTSTPTIQPTKTLSSCGHKFHEFCLRGWLLVGKKDVCPFCGEKIAFNDVSTHAKQPWQSDSQLFIQVLELVRYVLVWNPIIVFAIHIVFVLYFFIHHH